ncbi:pentapeptide repeat-containing protein, partial [Geminocystis sp. GBBB08]
MIVNDILKRYKDGDRDFRNVNLSKINLSGMKLSHSNLSNSKLIEAHLA